MHITYISGQVSLVSFCLRIFRA